MALAAGATALVVAGLGGPGASEQRPGTSGEATLEVTGGAPAGSEGSGRSDGAPSAVDGGAGVGERRPADVEELAWPWRRLADAGSAREHPSLAWTGSELLLWGGFERGRLARDGAAYDPVADDWRPLRDAPVPGRHGHVSEWTGSELLVWGGTDLEGPLDDGFAHDPQARRWRTVPASPLAATGQAAGAWTGDELVVVTGAGGWQAAAYEPDGETWRPLPDPPAEGRRVGAVWTGDEVVVVAHGVSASVARYDARRDAWSLGTPRPEALPAYGVEIAWTGEEVLVWGGRDRDPSRRGWAYDPDADTWRRLSDAWLGGTRTGAGSAWTGQYWIVRGTDDHNQPALAAYEPEADRWLALPQPPLGWRLGGQLAWTGEEVLVWSASGQLWAFEPSG